MEGPNDTEPFLPGSESDSESESPRPSKSILIRLYISHTLSTWNSRMFEFGAVLFLASIFQGTLLYASVYALVRSLAAVVCSSWLGSVVDRASRLRAVQQSIGTHFGPPDTSETNYTDLRISLAKSTRCCVMCMLCGPLRDSGSTHNPVSWIVRWCLLAGLCGETGSYG